MVDPFAPEGARFTAVSRSLATVRLIAATLFVLVPTLILGVFGVLSEPLLFFAAGPLLAIYVWLLWLIPRQVRALQFATTESDLLIRRGVMFRRMDAVPYGRIQYVQLEEGPVARKFQIATVKLFTASAQTDATLPGLTAEDAAKLRELLVDRGASNLSGI